MKSFAKALLPLCICALSASAYADEKPKNTAPLDIYNLSLTELSQVQISIATGNSMSLDKAPATASVIYAAEIEAMGARNLDEVLASVPGIHVSLSSLSRLDSVYSIRGIHTGFNSQVLLLLNGVPVQSILQGGHPTMFRLPSASIARVEVIRGPGSAVYGADAYAGVINVITKDAAAIAGTQVGARTGSFGSRELWLQSATQWNDVGIALNVAYQETDGDSSRRISEDFQTSLDNLLNTQASLAPNALSTRYQVLDTHLALHGERWQVNLWNWLSTNAGVGAGAAQALDFNGYDDNHLMMADATYHFNSSAAWDNSIRFSHVYSDHATQFDLFPAGASLPIGSDGNINFASPVGVVNFPDGLKGNPGQITKDTQLELVAMYSGWDSHRMRFSLGSRYHSFDGNETKNFGPGVLDTSPLPGAVDGTLTDLANTPHIYIGNSSRSIHFLSVQDEWQLHKNLALTAGVRYDNYSDFGGTTNPRFALVWAASENLTSKLLYGSAFRAPSFSELYFKNNPVSLGNPDLKPERIDTLELIFNYRFTPNLQTTLTLFSYEAKEMIDFVSDLNAPTKTAQNVRDQDGDGFELELSWKPISQLRLSSSYSLQDSVDAKTNTVVPDAPEHQIKFNADWEFYHNWFINTQLDRVSDRHRAVGDNRVAVDDYMWVNVTLRAKNILPSLDLSLAVRNATNADAREPSTGRIAQDYPLETRSAWVELKYQFN